MTNMLYGGCRDAGKLIYIYIFGGENMYIYMLLTEREVRTGGYSTVSFFFRLYPVWAKQVQSTCYLLYGKYKRNLFTKITTFSIEGRKWLISLRTVTEASYVIVFSNVVGYANKMFLMVLKVIEILLIFRIRCRI